MSTARSAPSDLRSGNPRDTDAHVCQRQRPVGNGCCSEARTNGTQLVHGGPCTNGFRCRCAGCVWSSRERALRKGGTMPPTSDSARHVHPVQGAVTAASASRSPRQARAARRRRHRMMLYLGLSLLGDRRFRKDAIIGAISLAVLAHLARESQVHARARLVAWWDALPGPADQASAGDRPATDRAA
jgi:hypothetical protein